MVLFSADSEMMSVKYVENSVSVVKLVLELMILFVGQQTFIRRDFDEGCWFAENSNDFCQTNRHTPCTIPLCDLRFDLLR